MKDMKQNNRQVVRYGDELVYLNGDGSMTDVIRPKTTRAPKAAQAPNAMFSKTDREWREIMNKRELRQKRAHRTAMTLMCVMIVVCLTFMGAVMSGYFG